MSKKTKKARNGKILQQAKSKLGMQIGTRSDVARAIGVGGKTKYDQWKAIAEFVGSNLIGAKKLPVAPPTRAERQGRFKSVRSDMPSVASDAFLLTYEWRRLRMQAIKQHGARCQCCGRSPQKDGITINVDHIKPRRLFPNLALDLGNLQVMCHDCNHGKGNWDQTDWRDRASVAETAPFPVANEPQPPNLVPADHVWRFSDGGIVSKNWRQDSCPKCRKESTKKALRVYANMSVHFHRYCCDCERFFGEPIRVRDERRFETIKAESEVEKLEQVERLSIERSVERYQQRLKLARKTTTTVVEEVMGEFTARDAEILERAERFSKCE